MSFNKCRIITAWPTFTVIFSSSRISTSRDAKLPFFQISNYMMSNQVKKKKKSEEDILRGATVVRPACSTCEKTKAEI